MKTILLTTLSLFILLTSCNKEKSTPQPTNTPTVPTVPNSFFLKKDGVAFSPIYIEISNPFGYAIAISAVASLQSSANSYDLMINKSIPVGTYDYETLIDEYDCWFSHSASNFELYAINDGTFEIIQQDTIQGILEMKFQFEMEDQYGQTAQVTEGQFIVNY